MAKGKRGISFVRILRNSLALRFDLITLRLCKIADFMGYDGLIEKFGNRTFCDTKELYGLSVCA